MWKLVQMSSGVIYKLLSKSPSTKKIIDQLIKNGGKPIKINQVPKGTKPTPVTPGNVAGILKNSRTGAGRPAPKPKAGTKPKAKAPTAKPKAGTKPPAKPAAPKTSTSKPPSKPKTDKPPLRSSTKTSPAKPDAAKPRTSPNVKTKPSTKPKAKTPATKPKTERSPFAKRNKKERDAAAKKSREQAEAMKKPNRSSNSGRFDKKGPKPTNVPKTGAKKGGLKSRIDAKAKRAAMGLGVAGVKADNLSQGELDIQKPVASRPTGKTGTGRPRPKPQPQKKKIPVVKADPNPIKVKPKESDQPKNNKPTMRPKQRPAAGPASDESFGTAFSKARRQDKKPTFTWKGKQYSTRFKEESVADHKKKFGDY